MKIAILDDYPGVYRGMPAIARLSTHDVTVFNQSARSPRELAAQLDGFDAVILTMQRSWFPREVITQLHTVRFISQMGQRSTHIDLAACAAMGIQVAAGRPAVSVEAEAAPTAELTWALVLSAMRNIPQEVQLLKSGGWQGSVGVGLYGKTLGIYAYGRLGSIVAGYGRAFGMRVVCWGRENSLRRAAEAGYEVAASRNAFFSGCDVISIHIRLSAETIGIVKAEDLAQMKTTALLVNSGRAALIEEGALVDALKRGRPGKAAVDVFENEPIREANHPLLKMDNATCTPHLGYVEMGNLNAMLDLAVDQVLAYAAGRPINLVSAAPA